MAAPRIMSGIFPRTSTAEYASSNTTLWDTAGNDTNMQIQIAVI